MYHVAVDIDGTIGYRNEAAFVEACNRLLDLGIGQSRLEGLSYAELLQQPELVAYQERWGEEYASRMVDWTDFDPEVLHAAHMMDGAIEGVRTLAASGRLAYYTARFSPESPERNDAMREATYWWLAAHQFPHADQVVFCAGLRDKLPRLAALLAENEQDKILYVDDQYRRVLGYLAELDAPIRDILRRRMILVAYGADDPLSELDGQRVLALPSWRHIETVLAVVSGKEILDASVH